MVHNWPFVAFEVNVAVGGHDKRQGSRNVLFLSIHPTNRLMSLSILRGALFVGTMRCSANDGDRQYVQHYNNWHQS